MIKDNNNSRYTKYNNNQKYNNMTIISRHNNNNNDLYKKLMIMSKYHISRILCLSQQTLHSAMLSRDLSDILIGYAKVYIVPLLKYIRLCCVRYWKIGHIVRLASLMANVSLI